MHDNTATAALAAYGLQGCTVTPLAAGLINQTFLVQGNNGRNCILQAVNPLFGSAGMADIERITTHLEAAGIRTPRLIKTQQNRLFTQAGGHTWRLYNHIPGETRHSVETPAAARSAGALLASIHQALAGLNYRLRCVRPGIHDTARHIKHLQTCLGRHRQHPAHAVVKALAADILREYQRLPLLPAVPPRLAHGDPKISNFLYAPGTDTAICMVDFDTLGYLPLPLEIGDALRSWGNPRGEDTEDGMFSADIALAALAGYAGKAKRFLRREEWQGIAAATQTVYIELAARFCADALTEDYFAWDAGRFTGHSEHSQVRARGQLSAALSLQAQRDELQAALAGLFAD